MKVSVEFVAPSGGLGLISWSSNLVSMNSVVEAGDPPAAAGSKTPGPPMLNEVHSEGQAVKPTKLMAAG